MGVFQIFFNALFVDGEIGLKVELEVVCGLGVQGTVWIRVIQKIFYALNDGEQSESGAPFILENVEAD